MIYFNIRNFVSVTFLFILFTQNLLACSLSLPAIKGFDDKEFVFIGTVIGYEGPFISPKINGKIWGVKVEVTDKVFLPQNSSTNVFDVFPYWLGSDCSDNGTDKKILETELPINSKVRVIARLAQALPPASTTGVTRLEISSGKYEILYRNDESGKDDTSAISVFNYNVEAMKSWSLLIFEVQKDLLRLDLAKTNKERKKILHRMRPLRFSSTINVDYDFITNHYDKNDVKSRNEKRKKTKF